MLLQACKAATFLAHGLFPVLGLFLAPKAPAVCAPLADQVSKYLPIAHPLHPPQSAFNVHTSCLQLEASMVPVYFSLLQGGTGTQAHAHISHQA